MNNLISKSISYIGLRTVLNGDERKIMEVIDNITINDVAVANLQARLKSEARQYWAKKLKTSPSKIYYGDLNDDNIMISLYNGYLPKKYIIGNAKFAYHYNLSDLKGVIGRLVCPKITNLPNLEFVTEGLEIGQSLNQNKKISANLPKLRNCPAIDLSGLKIISLGLENSDYMNLARCKIDKLRVKKARELILDSSNIKDISSLEKVDYLSLYSVDCRTLKINPNLIINKHVNYTNSSDEIIEKYLKKNKDSQKEI